MDKIRDFLEEYDDLLRCLDNISVADSTGYPNWMEDENHYGRDFSGERKVAMLWYSGESNNFYGIWTKGKDDEKNLDQYPIYSFYVDDEYVRKCEGNFKTFMREILREGKIDYDIIASSSDIEIDPDMQDRALEDLEQFSNNLLFDDDYILKLRE